MAKKQQAQMFEEAEILLQRLKDMGIDTHSPKPKKRKRKKPKFAISFDGDDIVIVRHIKQKKKKTKMYIPYEPYDTYSTYPFYGLYNTYNNDDVYTEFYNSAYVQDDYDAYNSYGPYAYGSYETPTFNKKSQKKTQYQTVTVRIKSSGKVIVQKNNKTKQF